MFAALLYDQICQPCGEMSSIIINTCRMRIQKNDRSGYATLDGSSGAAMQARVGVQDCSRVGVDRLELGA
jgi:hypothetical protein